MEDKKKAIQKYINDKKELRELVLQIIEKTDASDDSDFQNLNTFLTTHQYEGNKAELEHFLHLILIIANNHHRGENFFEKIEKILTVASKFYKGAFLNVELFTIFQESKQILLFLLRTKILIVDQIIFNYLLSFTYTNQGSTYYYFYPELNEIAKSNTIECIDSQNFEINNSDEFSIEDFEKKRQKGENDSILCSIIREDLIDEFIQFVHKTNISLSSELKRSIFESNSILEEKEATLIEYAAFFGSIQIMNYLCANNVEMKPTLWLYGVHSNNPEVIQFLEEKKIDINDRTFSECIKCHHDSVSHYIYDNYFDISKMITELSEDIISSIYSSENYAFFSEQIDCNKVFFSLCKNKFYELVELYLEIENDSINYFIRQNYDSNKKNMISAALKNNRIDVAYTLLKGYTFIPEKFIRNSSNIVKIALPPTINSILDYAFFRCSKLKQISIPSSVTLIGKCAFYECSSLEQIVIPPSVKSIEEEAFSRCSSLVQISIPPSVTSIGKSAFYDCSSLKRVLIPPLLTKLEYSIFWKCSSLTEVMIPLSVTSIRTNLFRECSSLRHATIPTSLKQFEGNCFLECSNLESISIVQCKEKITDLLEDNFLVYKSDSNNDVYDALLWVKPTLEIAVVPSFIKIIRNGACWGCRSLKEITIPSTVTQIENHIFYLCESLRSITNHSSITNIGISFCYKCSSLTQFTIPSSVKEINLAAFSECSSLKQITIPSSVIVIQSDAFFKCTSLLQITIPSSVKEIGSRVFENCTSLTQILLLSDLKEIEHSTFNDCTSLKEITIPSSVVKIGSCSFSGCASLTQIIIPPSVTEIEYSAFSRCSSLLQITIPSSVVKIGTNAFSGCTSLTQITIHSPITEIEEHFFYGCTSLVQVSLPSSVVIIKSEAFRDCKSLAQISLPSSVTEIRYAAFKNCTSLKQMLMPSSIVKIESKAFDGCESLTQISIPQSIEEIGSSLFYGCKSLRQISIPSFIKINNLGIPSTAKITKI